MLPRASQDCAPLETVITLLAGQSIIFKIFKPIAEVLLADVVDGVQTTLQAPGAVREHLTSSHHDSPMDLPMDLAMECDDDEG